MHILNRYLALSLFILPGIAANPILSHELRYRSDFITIENGLSGTSVTSIVQDRNGFIWIGTRNGLNRYDGYDIVVFRYLPHDTTSISNNNINTLFEDREGLLWAATNNGLNCYNQVTGEFRRYYFNVHGNSSQRNNHVSAITQDEQGRIWVGCQEGGLICLDKNTGAYKKYTNDFSDRSNTVYALLADNLNDRYLWIGTDDGLFLFDHTTGSFKKRSNGLPDDTSVSVQVIRQDPKGNLFLGTWGNGLIRYDCEASTFTQCYLPKENSGTTSTGVIRVMNFDSNGNLMFFVRDRGLMRYNTATGQIISVDTGEINNELNSRIVTAMFIERSGIIWIGTFLDGAMKLVKLINTFDQYNSRLDQDYWIGGGVVAIVEDSGGTLWIGTLSGGITTINRKTLRQNTYRQSPGGLSSNNIISLLEVEEKGKSYIWIGTDGGGLNKLDPATGKFRVFKNLNQAGRESSGLRGNSISSILQYDEDHLLIGTRDRNQGEGIYVFNIKTEKSVNLRYSADDALSLGSNNITKLFKDKSGTVWAGTRNGGLNKFVVKDINAQDPKDIGYFVRYTYNPADPASLGSTIYSIHDDPENKLWLGTNEGGLTMFDPVTGTFTNNINNRYLKDKLVLGILTDDNNNLWLSTSLGIVAFNPKTGKLHSFDKYDGLRETAFINGSHFKSSSGELFFGGIQGCNFFHPDSIKLNLKVPQIVITSFNVSGKKGSSSVTALTGKSVLASKLVKAPYNQNNFSITFSALDYHMPEKNRFMYMLDGYEKEWIETDAKRRYVNYTNLPPGKYYFRVIGSNSDDIWNHAGTSVTIIITPPFWRTTWFYAVMSAFFIGLVLLLFYLVLRKYTLQKKKVELEVLSSLQDEKKQLRTLLDNIPDLIFIKDRQSRFTLANLKVASVMGATMENLIGKTDFDFYSADVARAFFEDEQRIMQTGIPMINFEENAYDENGNKIVRSTTKVPVRNKDGVIIGIAGICRDITKLKKIENQLRKKSEDLQETNRLLEGRQKDILVQSEALAVQTQNLLMINTELDRLNRTKDKFFSIIAHDLRNPFNAIIGFCELLRNDFNDIDDHQKLNLLELINVSSQTAYNLLENLLEWARTQTDKINFEPGDFDLFETANAVVDLYCVIAKKKGIRLKNQVPENIIVYADKNMISTVLRNLVSNAIKFSNPNGEVVLTAESKSDRVEINVIDGGVGMNRESLGKLFRIDTYYSTSGTMGESGTGLGLIICKEFVEKNKGRIRATSAEGEGTTVTFTLNPGSAVSTADNDLLLPFPQNE